jgi:hypothetical protein
VTQEPYLLIKEPLLSRFTSLPLQICFKLLDLPRLGECRPSARFVEMFSLLSRRLPEAMLTTLADRGELLPGELAAAADLLLFPLLPWRPPPRLALRRQTRGHPSSARHHLLGAPFPFFSTHATMLQLATYPPHSVQLSTRIATLSLPLQFCLPGQKLPAILPVAGKQVADHSPTWAHLIYIRDTTSYISFLVDFGAALRVILRSRVQ